MILSDLLTEAAKTLTVDILPSEKFGTTLTAHYQEVNALFFVELWTEVQRLSGVSDVYAEEMGHKVKKEKVRDLKIEDAVLFFTYQGLKCECEFRWTAGQDLFIDFRGRNAKKVVMGSTIESVQELQEFMTFSIKELWKNNREDLLDV